MKFIVSFGGGLTSAEALRRTAVKHGRENTAAVCADVGRVLDEQGRIVCGEDDDFDRFLGEVEDFVGVKITRIKSQKYTDIWDVFCKRRMMGNSEVDPCSACMKRDPLDAWINGNFLLMRGDTLVLGMDWTEPSRITEYQEIVAPWNTYFPLNEEPRLTKRQIADAWLREGIEPPRLFEDGFPHNNCGGFCVNMGHYQAFMLYRLYRHRYDYHARREQEFRELVGKDVSILKDRRGGVTVPMTLLQLAARFESGYVPTRTPKEGCGGRCMMPPKKAEVVA